MSYRCLAFFVVLLPFSLEGKSYCHIPMAGLFLFFTNLATLKLGESNLCHTEFAEIPSSVVVELGAATPRFRCRHTSSEVLIFWRVNGLPSRDFPDIRSGSVNESGNIVHTLTVPAEPQYNGTEVVCLAVVFDGVTPITEVTPAATIIFLYTPPTPPTIVPGNFTSFQSALLAL